MNRMLRQCINRSLTNLEGWGRHAAREGLLEDIIMELNSE